MSEKIPVVMVCMVFVLSDLADLVFVFVLVIPVFPEKVADGKKRCLADVNSIYLYKVMD